MENVEKLNKIIASDFYNVPNLKFDIGKLRTDLESVLKNINSSREELAFKSIFANCDCNWSLEFS